MATALKTCRACGVAKTLDCFSPAGKYRQSRCKPCRTQQQQEYYQANLATQRAYHKNYDAQRVYDKAKKRSAGRRRYHAVLKHDPLFVLSDRIRRSVNYAMKGHVKRGKTFDLLGYTPDSLRAHLMRYVGGLCERCGVATIALSTAHIDHIMPIRTATSRADVLRLNMLSNLRLICGPCNLSKQGRIED